MDSNHRPHDYQSCALASWAIGPYRRNQIHNLCFCFIQTKSSSVALFLLFNWNPLRWAFNWYEIRIWGFSSAGRAPALQAGGQRFDPANLHHILRETDWSSFWKEETSLSFLERLDCTLKTEHWRIMMQLWEGNSKEILVTFDIKNVTG